MFQPLIFSYISLHELKRRGNKQNKILFKLMIQQLVKIQLHSLYCGNTNYLSLWGMMACKLHSQKSKITLQFIPNSKRLATDVCVNLTLQSEDSTVLPQIQLQQQRRAVSVCCVHVGCMDGYIGYKKVCMSVCVFACLYEQSMSEEGHV